MTEESLSDIIKAIINEGKTGLHLAASNNDLSLVRQLLSEGADVNAKSTFFNRTPLFEAAEANEDESHFDVIKILLKHGADPNAKFNAEINHSSTPFHYLVSSSNKKTVQLFLNFKADVNAVNEFGQTPLFSAAFNKNVEVVQFLVDIGSDVNHRDFNGQTSLHLACGHRAFENLKTIKCLLTHGDNMNVADLDGFTPLLYSLRLARNVNCEDHLGMFGKSLNFIMIHTDFNITHKNMNIFTIPDKLLLKSNLCVILRHIAKLKALNIPVHPDISNTISRKSHYKEYFNQLEEELLRAKSTKLPNSWISFFNLLTDSRRKIKNYAGNREMIKDFEKIDLLEEFPAYGTTMSENLKKGIKRLELLDWSVIKLSDSMPIFHPTHLIVRDILDCILSKKDLSKFCEETSCKFFNC